MDMKKFVSEKNESNIDRAVRIVLGLVLAYAFTQGYLSGLANIAMLLVGIILLITGILGHCTVYSILGIRTNK